MKMLVALNAARDAPLSSAMHRRRERISRLGSTRFIDEKDEVLNEL
jgi:hypothetical protein